MSPDVVDSLPGIVDIVPVFVCSFPPDGGWKVLREIFPSVILHFVRLEEPHGVDVGRNLG